MLKVLLNKQLTEIFRSYFYDAKKNKARSKGSVIAYAVLYAFIMVVVLGGVFIFMSVTMCGPFVSSGLDWLYFAVMGLIAVLLGSFGSVFNTYSGLYLAKDNDLLLSMPIPVKYIMISRLLGVYIMGAMYSCVVIVPAAVVYTVTVGFSFRSFFAPLLFTLLITVFVLTLSCALGWVTAKISSKLKNKSFITVIVSLVFFGIYYFICFKAQDILSEFIMNADVYGDKIKSAAYPVYVFGAAGAGETLPLVIVTVVVLALFALTWALISKSFLKIAVDTGKQSVKKLKSVSSSKKSVSSALVSKEFSKFFSSPAYMLNCGLGTLTVPIAGVIFLIKGESFMSFIAENSMLDSRAVALLMCFAVCLVSSMNDICAPTISLEGKNIWLLQSLPVKPIRVLLSKLSVQLVLTSVPCLFSVIAVAVVCRVSAVYFILLLAAVLSFVLFYALFGLMLSLKMPNLTWTSEITPIKQGGSVLISMLVGFAVPLLFLVPSFYLSQTVAPEILSCVFIAVMLISSAVLWAWMKKKGGEIFAALSV